MVRVLEILVILKEVGWLALSPMVRLRDVLHATIVSVGVVDSNPKGNTFWSRQWPIGIVLVPFDGLIGMWRLPDEVVLK